MSKADRMRPIYRPVASWAKRGNRRLVPTNSTESSNVVRGFASSNPSHPSKGDRIYQGGHLARVQPTLPELLLRVRLLVCSGAARAAPRLENLAWEE